MKSINEALNKLIELNNNIDNYLKNFSIYSTSYPFPLHDVHSEISTAISLIRGEAMTNEIKGYRKLTDEQVTAINTFKNIESDLLTKIAQIYNISVNLHLDERWKSIAITHFQQGFMALNRSIAKPDE